VGEQKAKRFRFEIDDSGHHYLIPADQKETFNQWLVISQEEFENWSGIDFNEYRIGGSYTQSAYTFCDPQLDK
jgi:hypothetical protein